MRTVVGACDPGGIRRQLGVQIAVRPPDTGPVSFGTAVHVASQRPGQSGAISVTSLHVRDAGEAADVRERSRAVSREVMGIRGFMG